MFGLLGAQLSPTWAAQTGSLSQLFGMANIVIKRFLNALRTVSEDANGNPQQGNEILLS